MRNIRQFDFATQQLESQLFDLSTDVMTQLMHVQDLTHTELQQLRVLASEWFQLALVKTDPRRG